MKLGPIILLTAGLAGTAQGQKNCYYFTVYYCNDSTRMKTGADVVYSEVVGADCEGGWEESEGLFFEELHRKVPATWGLQVRPVTLGSFATRKKAERDLKKKIKSDRKLWYRVLYLETD